MSLKPIVAVLLLASASTAAAHSFYSPVCCSDKDCKPIPASDVEATSQGWRIILTGETFAYDDHRIKPSPDGAFHRCAASANFTAQGHTLCLYVPGMGS